MDILKNILDLNKPQLVHKGLCLYEADGHFIIENAERLARTFSIRKADNTYFELLSFDGLEAGLCDKVKFSHYEVAATVSKKGIWFFANEFKPYDPEKALHSIERVFDYQRIIEFDIYNGRIIERELPPIKEDTVILMLEYVFLQELHYLKMCLRKQIKDIIILNYDIEQSNPIRKFSCLTQRYAHYATRLENDSPDNSLLIDF